MGATDRTMHAVIFDEPAPDGSRTRVTARPIPVPQPTEVTIDVEFATVNFKDVMARRGDPGYVTAWPFVPGLEAAGVVRAVGSEVTGVEPGARVVAFTGEGAQAEVVAASAALTIAVPDHLDLASAAAAPGALTTARLLVDDMARVRAGDAVLVHSAAGGVGQALAQLLHARGARPILGTVGNADRVEPARAAGYTDVFVRDASLEQHVRAATDGRGVDVALDPQGTAMLDLDLAVAAPTGRIVAFGNAGGDALDHVATPRLLGGNVSVGGFSLAAFAQQAPTRLAAALSGVLDDLAAERLTVAPRVGAGLGHATAFHDELARGYAGGKLVVAVREPLRG